MMVVRGRISVPAPMEQRLAVCGQGNTNSEHTAFRCETVRSVLSRRVGSGLGLRNDGPTSIHEAKCAVIGMVT